MKRALLRSLSLCNRNYLSPPTSKPLATPKLLPLSVTSTSSSLRLFSSENDLFNGNSGTLAETNLIEPEKKELSLDVEDVSNKELKLRIDNYFKGDEEALPSILEAILRRKLTGKHEETDEELLDDLQLQPLDDVKDTEFESDFEELCETDEDIDNLYNAKEYAVDKIVKDKYFNMDDKKWDEMIKEATEKGFLKDTGECERILEDMLNWDKLLPDSIKQKVEVKFNELGNMCERGELEPEEAYERFKEFEDKIVTEYGEMMEAGESSPQCDEENKPDQQVNASHQPGEGPELRWTTRVVFAPGGDAWHPKNRKVKMAVTVKELGLSKHEFRRLKELVGKRYHPGKDELTITSERFEHREENRKDCLRTLLSLLEEAGKADRLVEEARTSYVKGRLRANPQFMERLNAKTMRLRALDSGSS